MKLLLTVLCLSGGLMLTNGQDYGTVNFNLVMSLLNVSNSQYLRAIEYINEYNEANRQLSQVSTDLLFSNLGSLFSNTIQPFLSNIQENLNKNIQELIAKYSPESVYSFIVFYYQIFLNNLITNNGTQVEVAEMNSLYSSKLISLNASACMAKYNNNHLQIYSSVASNFREAMEKTVGTTVDELEGMRKEIKEMIAEIVTPFTDIIKNPMSALQLFENFMSKNGTQIILGQIVTWVTKFTALMKQTQTDIKTTFNQLEASRLNQTLTLAKETVECLRAA